MNKKAVENEIIYAARIVLIIAIVGILIFFWFSQKAPLISFVTNLSQSFGLNLVKDEAYTQLETKVEAICQQSSSNIEAYSNSVMSEIDTQIRGLEPGQQYLLNKYTQLKGNAAAYKDACKTNMEFLAMEYKGEPPAGFQKALDDKKASFQNVVNSHPGTAGAKLASDMINTINAIYNCDDATLKAVMCSPGKSNKFCVKWTQDTAFLKNVDFCGFANCDSANKKNYNYCKTMEGIQRCVAVGGTQDNAECLSCDKISKCDDYKSGEDACNKDSCSKGLDCEFPHFLGPNPNAGPCRPKGTNLMCSDYSNDQNGCLNLKNAAVAPKNCVFIPSDEHGNGICKDCSEINNCGDYNINNIDKKYIYAGAINIGQKNCEQDSCSKNLKCVALKSKPAWQVDIACVPCTSITKCEDIGTFSVVPDQDCVRGGQKCGLKCRWVSSFSVTQCQSAP